MSDQEKTNLYPSMEEKTEAPKAWGYPEMDRQEIHQEVIAAGPKAGISYDSLDGFSTDPETRELVALADQGKFDELATRIITDLKALGCTDRDVEMVRYLRDVGNAADPAWRKWAKDMSLFVRGSVRGRKK